MRKLLFIIASILLMSSNSEPNFIQQQKKYSRVKQAFEEKEDLIEAQLKLHGFQKDQIHILFTAYKADEIMEVYAKKINDSIYKKIDCFDICQNSGFPGPKREQGDRQVPEGFYHIDRFNPNSAFHLSLGINYPNKSDSIKSYASNLGGDIFIHGNCMTIGCLPMTDEGIKEIYLYAVYARNNGQNKIPVYIFPSFMDDENYNNFSQHFQDDKELLDFWAMLKKGYQKFKSEQKELNIKVSTQGDYQFL